MAQKPLRTTRLHLQPLSEEHLKHFKELNSHPEVLRFIYGRALTEQEAAQDHAERLTAGTLVPGLGLWSGFTADSGEFVGWWALSPVIRDDGGALDPTAGNLGYRLLPRFWRQGLAKEGALEVLRHGFVDLGLQRVRADTMAVNEASRATMASCGLRYLRTFFVEFEEPLPGTQLGEVEYGLTLNEWLALPGDKKAYKVGVGRAWTTY
ncbi:Acyl-CoA N-acyltransferase [Akanthomyces lecanii RCEF 1005]|uniref:Acyl-CoA N-acyltransferase n=1 Tax=Akanthomyces lecanii RCEF 1005 TaxID=1081108 RepID=A0A168HY33_CORDF|nr:Acyl-CoA N-acyltransferase [Akanthomyces lecanii RCEF 1005]